MAYAEIEELQLLLRIDNPTQPQLDAMQRALDEAAEEIDWELDYTVDDPGPGSSAAPSGRREPRPGGRALAAVVFAVRSDRHRLGERSRGDGP